MGIKLGTSRSVYWWIVEQELSRSEVIFLFTNQRSVALMERTVMELEAGNYDADDSDVKHRYDNQRQLNIQLQEQKRWLEHELEQVSNPKPL